MRHEKPSYRVWRAMKRISRDKWLSPEEVGRISRGLAYHCCWGHGAQRMALKFAIDDLCIHVGMIDGKPPFDKHEKGFNLFRKWIATGNKRTPAELAILNFKIKEKQ